MIRNFITHLFQKPQKLSFDYDISFLPLYEKTKDFTMTSPERMYAMYKSVEYIEKSAISGDIVECGVWRSGMMMIAAKVLKRTKSQTRSLYLYDTYTGMTKPGHLDKTLYDGAEATSMWKKGWCFAPLDEVQRNMSSTRYPKNKIIFVQGDVLHTIPKQVPKKISILRLDTDWYESTMHELVHLYPRLVKGGVLIIDDYGHWQGAKKAVDEYFKKHNISMLLNRIDYTGRMGIKVD